ncbi:MAG: class I SAM-dependent methyltransferase [Myxococcota bacterium]
MIMDDARDPNYRPSKMAKRPPKCRICDAGLHTVLDLGRQPRADAFRSPDDSTPEYMFDLQLGLCESCGAVQLVDEVPAELMFNASYPFRTSTSQRMQRHFRDTAMSLLKSEVHTHTKPFMVEFGCNDGTFLTPLAEAGVAHLGVDPAANLVAEAVSRGINAQSGWFNADTASSILSAHRSATVIYAANTLCHISDLASVFVGVDVLLAKDGCFVFEDPYLGDIVEIGAFDQIYDEHIHYFTATSIDVIARKHGLALIDAQPLDTHGGQLRYTVARPHQKRTKAVEALLETERRMELHSRARLGHFASVVESRREELTSTLEALSNDGKRIAGYAATAKSATVLNYCGIDSALLSVIYDTTPEKHGRLAPGTGIPIEPFPTSVDDYPDIFLLLAWNHAREIAAREPEFAARGGMWLQYIPGVKLTKDPVA